MTTSGARDKSKPELNRLQPAGLLPLPEVVPKGRWLGPSGAGRKTVVVLLADTGERYLTTLLFAGHAAPE